MGTVSARSMTRREIVLVSAFFVCFVVLFSPLFGWYLFFVFNDPFYNPTTLDKIIAAVLGAQSDTLLGAQSDTFNILSIFMAPIGVLIAARISGYPNSPLILISIPFILALLLAVIAPSTITQHIIDQIPNLLDHGNGPTWAQKAGASFKRYAESYASTSAVLLGLHFTVRPV